MVVCLPMFFTSHHLFQVPNSEESISNFCTPGGNHGTHYFCSSSSISDEHLVWHSFIAGHDTGNELTFPKDFTLCGPPMAGVHFCWTGTGVRVFSYRIWPIFMVCQALHRFTQFRTFLQILSFLPFKAYRLFHTSCDGGLCHCRPGRRHEIGKTTVELNNAGSGKRCSGFHFLVHILTIFLHFSTRIVIFRSGGNNQSMWRPSPTRNSRLDHLIE